MVKSLTVDSCTMQFSKMSSCQRAGWRAAAGGGGAGRGGLVHLRVRLEHRAAEPRREGHLQRSGELVGTAVTLLGRRWGPSRLHAQEHGAAQLRHRVMVARRAEVDVRLSSLELLRQPLLAGLGRREIPARPRPEAQHELARLERLQLDVLHQVHLRHACRSELEGITGDWEARRASL